MGIIKKDEEKGINIDFVNDDKIEKIWPSLKDDIKAREIMKVIQRECADDIKIRILAYTNKKKIPEETIKDMIDLFKNNFNILLSIYGSNQSNSNIFLHTFKYMQDNPKHLKSILQLTSRKVILENMDYMIEGTSNKSKEAFNYVVEAIWDNAKYKKYREEVLKLIKNDKTHNLRMNPGLITKIWKYYQTEERENLDNVFNIICIDTDEKGKKVENPESISIVLQNTELFEDFNRMWSKISSTEQEANILNVYKKVTDGSDEQFIAFLENTFGKDIEYEKLNEILAMEDIEELKTKIKEAILLDFHDINDTWGNNVNEKINEFYDVFLTNNLPSIFKRYYKSKINEGEKNSKEYMSGLLKDDLDSHNTELANFLELLYYGDKAYEKKVHGQDLEELEQAILLSFSKAMLGLYRIFENKIIQEKTDCCENIMEIRRALYINRNKNKKSPGDYVLRQFLDYIGFEYENDENNISIKLLEKMQGMANYRTDEKPNNEFFGSIVDYTREATGYVFSDMSYIKGILENYKEKLTNREGNRYGENR